MNTLRRLTMRGKAKEAAPPPSATGDGLSPPQQDRTRSSTHTGAAAPPRKGSVHASLRPGKQKESDLPDSPSSMEWVTAETAFNQKKSKEDKRKETMWATMRRKKEEEELEQEFKQDELDENDPPNIRAEKRIKQASAALTINVRLSALGISELPSNFTLVKDFARNLDLSINKLTHMPSSIEGFTALQTLQLHGNQLEELPSEIGKLSNLQELQLNGNKLKTLPPQLGCMEALTKLYCNNNQIVTLPDEIGCLTALEELHLAGNKLEYIPETIGNCTFLEICDLSGCQLKKLPDQFCYLFRLLELDLGVNKLEQLPEAIGCLTRLQRLNFSDNHLTEIPLSIGSIVNLQDCRGEGNRITDPDLQYAMQFGAEHILDYCQKKVLAMPDTNPDDFLKQIEQSRPAVPSIWPPGKPKPAPPQRPVKQLTAKEVKAMTLRKDAGLRERVIKAKEAAYLQYEQTCGYLEEVNKSCTPDDPMDDNLFRELSKTIEEMKEPLAKWKEEEWMEVEPDADKIVIDLALLENVSKTARTIMRGIRSDEQANAVLLYVKLLNTLYEILYKHLQQRGVNSEPVAIVDTTPETDLDVVLSSTVVPIVELTAVSTSDNN